MTGSGRNSRICTVGEHPINPAGKFLVYWMTSARRVEWNFGLERAVTLANSMGQPLVIFEPLSIRYSWASTRFHSFVLDGMEANHAACKKSAVTYVPFVETRTGEGKRALELLAQKASMIITDKFPAFFLSNLGTLLAEHGHIRVEEVDSNGILPLDSFPSSSPSAYHFRRRVQKELPGVLQEFPQERPLEELIDTPPSELDSLFHPMQHETQRYLTQIRAQLNTLPIDQSVKPVELRGGSVRGTQRILDFLNRDLRTYHQDRTRVLPNGGSQLSPYLHFGHVSSHQVVKTLLESQDWSPALLGPKAHGKRLGWWGLNEGTETFLDQIIVWRELGFQYCHHHPETYMQFESLPRWAQESLQKHKNDPRPEVYSLAELEAAHTGDDIWNAAQKELVQTGLMHNYLRMLWGKKILQWTTCPREALNIMIHLNNRYALDGRDPNSTSGIFWTLGRFDRAWGPERPIFGKVRYMTSDGARRKLKLTPYLQRFGPNTEKKSPLNRFGLALSGQIDQQ